MKSRFPVVAFALALALIVASVLPTAKADEDAIPSLN